MNQPCPALSAVTLAIAASVMTCPAIQAEDLEAGFRNPPAQARLHTYWFWMNGNITCEGITADLEAIASVGVGGAMTFFKEDINGAHGKVFRVDLNKKCFELLKTLQYDFDKDVGGKAWHTVYWTDETTITKVIEETDFAGIKSPCIVDFRLDENNAKALASGKPSTFSQAIIDPDTRTATGATNDNQRVVGLFTPDAGPAPKSGTIKVNGKDVKASLGRRNSQIYLHQTLTPVELGKGSNVHFGAAEQPILGKAVADAMVTALKSRSETKSTRALSIAPSGRSQ